MQGQIEELFGAALPIAESWKIMRNRYTGSGGGKRISVITGIHGDEIEGQYVCYLLSKWLKENHDKLIGTVDIYPAVNSIGIDMIQRGIPFYEVDLNRQFPGHKEDFLPAQIADAIVEAVEGSDIAIDIHASNIFLREIPQARINKIYGDELTRLAKMLNIDFIWIHDAVTVLESTLSYALNQRNIKTVVVEMGVGMRITKEYCHNLFYGILNLMSKEGIINFSVTAPLKEPIISEHGEVYYLNAQAAGLFIPEIDHCQMVQKGQLIGAILDPLTGEVVAQEFAPEAGILFTLREYPIVYEGSLICRIFGEKSDN